MLLPESTGFTDRLVLYVHDNIIAADLFDKKWRLFHEFAIREELFIWKPSPFPWGRDESIEK